jgi:hypothetical protein
MINEAAVEKALQNQQSQLVACHLQTIPVFAIHIECVLNDIIRLSKGSLNIHTLRGKGNLSKVTIRNRITGETKWYK